MESIKQKVQNLQEMFSNCPTPERKYQLLIKLGRDLGKLPQDKKCSENIVQGCQSTVFLHSFLKNECLFFEAEADALISAGLVAILLFVYSGESPEVILTSTPDFLEKLGMMNSLTLNRANGFYSIHLRMKQDALKALSIPKAIQNLDLDNAKTPAIQRS